MGPNRASNENGVRYFTLSQESHKEFLKAMIIHEICSTIFVSICASGEVISRTICKLNYLLKFKMKKNSMSIIVQFIPFLSSEKNPISRGGEPDCMQFTESLRKV